MCKVEGKHKLAQSIGSATSTSMQSNPGWAELEYFKLAMEKLLSLENLDYRYTFTILSVFQEGTMAQPPCPTDYRCAAISMKLVCLLLTNNLIQLNCHYNIKHHCFHFCFIKGMIG